MNKETPETIYLIPGEYDGQPAMVWSDSPAPGEGCDPGEAVRYVRYDRLAAEAAEVAWDLAELANLDRITHRLQAMVPKARRARKLRRKDIICAFQNSSRSRSRPADHPRQRGQLMHQPKGRQCATCAHKHRDCSALPFDQMRAHERLPDGRVVVICSEWIREGEVK